MLHDLIINAALLVVFSVFYGALIQFRLLLRKWINPAMGFLFGLIAVVGMNIPLQYSDGIIFDGRSIILSLAGLFGGGLAGGIAALIATLFRIWMGGAGTMAGVASIFFSVLVGILVHRQIQQRRGIPSLKQLLITAFAAHVLMLMSQLLLPWPLSFEVIKEIGPLVITFFPAVTIVVGLLMLSTEKRLLAEAEVRESESLYRTTLYSIGDAVILTDRQGRINKMNPVACQLTGWSEEDAKGELLEDVFVIVRESSREKVDSPVKKVMQTGTIVGLANHTLLISKDGREIPIADSGAPVIDDAGMVTGVVMVFQDQTMERRQQRKIKKSQAQYRNMIEATEAVAWEYDIQKDRWVYIAPQAVRQFGWSPEEWTNMEFWRTNIHPDDREWATRYFNSNTQNKKNHTLEYRFRKKNGEYLWLRDVVSVHGEADQPTLLRGFMFDIDHRKRTELDLQDSEQQFRKLFENHTAVKLLLDPETGSIVNANKAASEFYGWSREELMQMNLSQINTLSPERIKEEMRQAKNNSRAHFQFKHRVANGSVHDVEVFASCVELKGKDYLHSIVHDVTEKKKAEESLRLLSKSLEQSPVAIIITDSDGHINYVNPEFTKLIGYSLNEVKGRLPNIFNPALNTSTETFDEIWNCLHANKDWKGEYLNTRKTGESFWENNIISPLIDTNGKVSNYIIIKEDISLQKQLISDLKVARNLAEESEQLKTAFLANMSHEIRTPLNGILGFTELLTSGIELPPEQREEYGTIIYKSAEGLLQIINDVLDISRLESGHISIENKPFIINEALLALFALYAKKIEDKGKGNINLSLEMPDEKIEVTADENRFRQIMINLLDNAVKFTDAGQISFGISKINNTHIEFLVSDTGLGISPEKQKVIFDRFRQADNSIASRFGGTGLGLAIVKKLTEIMGDGILLESEPDKGSTFKFHLPGRIFEG
ncbi:PAS domain S-box protein [Marinilabilia sp.]|uniref:PAS domain S-box protein n=1 Tax=Marinilabilia sp. TaxID=2021252 RepID=UPI0025C04CC0|nr:PAS domain S-box protein [Marinilabilia sp.]